MSFKDCKIKQEYRTLADNIIQDFYLPILHEATIYKRAVGYFSSTALIEVSKGISELVKHGDTFNSLHLHFYQRMMLRQ